MPAAISAMKRCSITMAGPNQITSAGMCSPAQARAASVGGIVAVGFGQKPPAGAGDKRARRPSWRKLDRATWGPWTSLNLAVLGRLVTHDVPSDRWRSIAGGVYAIVYFIWGIAAVVTWVFFTAVTPDLVKNLAATFLGLALPVVTAFMRRG